MPGTLFVIIYTKIAVRSPDCGRRAPEFLSPADDSFEYTRKGAKAGKVDKKKGELRSQIPIKLFRTWRVLRLGGSLLSPCSTIFRPCSGEP